MFKKYNRKAIPAEMRPYIPGEQLPVDCSVSPDEAREGHPKQGDMVARDPSNHANTWIVKKSYFEEKFDPEPIGDCAD